MGQLPWQKDKKCQWTWNFVDENCVVSRLDFLLLSMYGISEWFVKTSFFNYQKSRKGCTPLMVRLTCLNKVDDRKPDNADSSRQCSAARLNPGTDEYQSLCGALYIIKFPFQWSPSSRPSPAPFSSRSQVEFKHFAREREHFIGRSQRPLYTGSASVTKAVQLRYDCI